MRIEDGHSGGKSERFRVDPDEIRDMGGEFLDLGDQCGQAKSYASSNLKLEGDGGSVLQSFFGWVYDLDGALSEFFGDLQKVVTDSGTGLRQAATLYENIDHDAAVRLDREYWSH